MRVMNAMVVPEGTYEMCSSTEGMSTDNITWVLNINWQMQGLDVHLDTNIGRQVSALGSTLTSLIPEEDQMSDAVTPDDVTGFLVPHVARNKHDAVDLRAIVDAMNKQSKKVEDMKSSGALKADVEMEQRRLALLEMTLFRDFRNEIAKKINRQIVHPPQLGESIVHVAEHFRSHSVDTVMTVDMTTANTQDHMNLPYASTRHSSMSVHLGQIDQTLPFGEHFKPEFLQSLDKAAHNGVANSGSADTFTARTKRGTTTGFGQTDGPVLRYDLFITRVSDMYVFIW